MKVIETSENKKFPIRHTCEQCSAVLEIEEEDCKIGVYGLPYVTCPVCGNESYVDEATGKALTPCTINYPQHFSSTNNAVPIDDAKIQEWVQEIFGRLVKSRDEGETLDFTYIASGDTMVFGTLVYPDCDIYVCKKYEDCYIDLSEE